MIPADLDLELYRGDTKRAKFRLWGDADKTIPLDLTDVAVAAMIKDKATGGSVAVPFACEVSLPNIIDLVLSSAQSSTLPLKGVWDLQLTYLSGDVVTVIKGSVIVVPDVTPTAAATQQRLVAVK